ncbi:hypothetical protein CAI16_16515 [Virgibacillus dokdonensis]|uniref:Amine oxidase domain-containing protein n=1 Tax=Virgibacillus dokdonensis TaxID=302167 RepID=A0A3E0WLX3_9BACI|nr:NAD(P)/FAD-dependent oxidoreductase [Virgibacillus dokdonensis]RFA32966.1 hypothetical protein CAI16_16515 [Virgibacillus dokdonensis]
MSDRYDVVVIGSGLGGLSCGARLSKLGYRVAVFEKHIYPGGYASYFKRKKYLFDVSLHGIGGLAKGDDLNQILHACGVADRITPLQKKYPYSFELNNQVYDVPQNWKEYNLLLCSLFPEEKQGIHKLFEDLRKFKKEVAFLYTRDVPQWKKGMLFPFKCRLLMKWSNKTVQQVLEGYVSSSDFINIFTVLWSYYGLPPKKLASLYFLIPWLSYHLEGTYYIQGGGQALSKELTEVIKEHGGEVFLRKEVDEIIVKEYKEIFNVKSTKGQEVYANWLVSNTSPYLTLKLFKENFPKELKKFSKHIDKLTIGTSILQLYLGIKGDPKSVGMNREEIFFVEETDTYTDYQRSISGDYQNVNLSITNYNAMDCTLNEKGRGVIVVTCLDHINNWPEYSLDYREKKREVTNILLERVEERYPGLKEKIEVMELGTPRTMLRYTSNPNGAVYGFEQTVSQSGIKRLKNQSPLRNLSFVGAWTQPGGGYQGAITSGFLEANRIAKKMKKHKRKRNGGK